MTDREKLIELLNENFTEYCNVDIIAGHCKIRAITFEVDRFADFLISNGVTFQTWIPVSERLPENNTAVIVATDNGMVFQCLYAYDGWDLWDGYKVNITHWMPLPNPPKEVDK